MKNDPNFLTYKGLKDGTATILNFINDPKPVIWEGKFKQQKGENSQKALKRCYKDLLSFRNERYSLLADYVLDYSFLHNPNIDVSELLVLMEKGM